MVKRWMFIMYKICIKVAGGGGGGRGQATNMSVYSFYFTQI